ncbi:hypothetical protein BKA81DRAFT_199099 [Phyllosticta paracitricarpa]
MCEAAWGHFLLADNEKKVDGIFTYLYPLTYPLAPASRPGTDSDRPVVPLLILAVARQSKTLDPRPIISIAPLQAQSSPLPRLQIHIPSVRTAPHRTAPPQRQPLDQPLPLINQAPPSRPSQTLRPCPFPSPSAPLVYTPPGSAASS